MLTPINDLLSPRRDTVTDSKYIRHIGKYTRRRTQRASTRSDRAVSASESRQGKGLAGVRFLPEDFRSLEIEARELNVTVPVLIRARLGLPLPNDPWVPALELV